MIFLFKDVSQREQSRCTQAYAHTCALYMFKEKYGAAVKYEYVLYFVERVLLICKGIFLNIFLSFHCFLFFLDMTFSEEWSL